MPWLYISSPCSSVDVKGIKIEGILIDSLDLLGGVYMEAGLAQVSR